MSTRSRRARPADVAGLARGMPFTREVEGSHGRPVFQVGGRSFVFFRNPRPDAVDADGRRLPDVVVLWVASEADKQALVQDETSPFFSTPHFDGHPSVLLRLADVGRLSLAELTEVVQDAWLARASARRGRDWLAQQGLARPPTVSPTTTGSGVVGSGRAGAGERTRIGSTRGRRQPRSDPAAAPGDRPGPHP